MCDRWSNSEKNATKTEIRKPKRKKSETDNLRDTRYIERVQLINKALLVGATRAPRGHGRF